MNKFVHHCKLPSIDINWVIKQKFKVFVAIHSSRLADICICAVPSTVTTINQSNTKNVLILMLSCTCLKNAMHYFLHCSCNSNCWQQKQRRQRSRRHLWHQSFSSILPSILIWITWPDFASGITNGANIISTANTSHHKQHRSAALHAWNNFTDISSNDAHQVEKELSNIGFDSKSSIVLVDTKTNIDCPSTTSSHCLRCTNDGCIKCPLYLVTDTRQCVDRCPSGYIDQWSAHTEFMGRVCVSTGYSNAAIAALAGLIGGFLVCLSLLAVAVVMIKRRRRRKMIKEKLINENVMDRADFIRQLNELRPNAEYFLAMLNDTRRQIRKLYLSGEVAAANSYRPLIRDLAKILILLNRPVELIPAVPPHDWNRLYAWSEQVLERYRPQVGQLIDFFQTTNFDDGFAQFDAQFEKNGGGGGGGGRSSGSFIYKQCKDAGGLQRSTNDLSTLGTQTASQKLHLFGSLISLHEFEEPRPSDPFGSSFNTLKGNLITDLNTSSGWLEDEFYKLGFRPQDVITTEL